VKKAAGFFALALATSSLGSPASEGEAAVELSLYRACDAFRDGEVAYLSEFLGDGFTLTDSSGKVTTRDETLAEIRNREPRYEVFRNHGMNVRLYGDTALVNGVTSLKGTSSGQPFEVEVQFTDTLIRKSGRWVLVASHASRISN
jgi:uncharacterized protein DUF4440